MTPAKQKPLAGHCLCGAVTIRVEGEFIARTGACHCHMCQRWTGGLFLCFHAVHDAVHVDGPVKIYPSSDFAERAFCTECGTHLWMRDTGATAESYDLMPGLFAESSDWPLQSEIYIDQAMKSVALKGDHPRLTAAEYESEYPHL